jgi:parallel beta-helix repeat protein
MRNLTVAVAVVWALAGLPAASQATTYYVRVFGNDAATGATPATAWRTLGHATEQLLPGDEAIVGPGVYAESNLKFRISGGPYGHIGLRGDPSGQLTGDPAGPVNVNVAGASAAFVISARDYIDLSGLTITNSKNAGIYVITGRNGGGNTQGSDHITIANCFFHSNLGKGIIIRGGSNTLIFNNLFYKNAGGGISIGFKGSSSPGTQIINNTFYQNVGLTGFGNGITVGGGSPAPQTLVLNNITVGNHKGISVSRDSATLSTYVGLYNAVLDGYGSGARRSPTDINLDPLLVDPDGPDNILGIPGELDDNFHLALPSPVVNGGSDTATALGLNNASTREDGGKDSGTVDLGFHYGNTTLGPTRLNVQTFLYVRQSGNDGNGGRTPSDALRTISRAAQIALPGDVIVVGPGFYAEKDIKPKKSGASEIARLMFLGDASGSRTQDAPGPVIVNAGGGRSGFRVTRRDFVTISGFRVTGASKAGILVGQGKSLVVDNNITYSNQGQGIQLADADDGQVVNNLTYANRGSGIFVGGSGNGSARVLVTNNTVYANKRGGIRIGTGRFPCPGATVLYNILRENRYLVPNNLPNGIRIQKNSLNGLTLGYNLNSDGYQGVGQPPTDIVGDPFFIDPDGADGILGDVGAADDDFRVAAISAGDIANSLALDAGLDCSSQTGMVFTGYTTQRDSGRDEKFVDLGFHYILPSACGGNVRCIVGVLRTPVVPPLQRCK